MIWGEAVCADQLAPIGFVDDLLTQRGTQHLEMIAVGYGLQESWPTTSKKPQQPTGLVVAVNSFGVAPYCKGNDYACRVDIPNSSTFIFSYR